MVYQFKKLTGFEVSKVFSGFLGFCRWFSNEVSMKKDLDFRIAGFPVFFVFFSGFLGYKTPGNLPITDELASGAST